LQAGKKLWRSQKRVEGRWPYGEHPNHGYDAERAVVARIREQKASGISSYQITQTLNAERIRTRYGKLFTTQTIQNIFRRASVLFEQVKSRRAHNPVRISVLLTSRVLLLSHVCLDSCVVSLHKWRSTSQMKKGVTRSQVN
jgi:hypothetical protein